MTATHTSIGSAMIVYTIDTISLYTLALTLGTVLTFTRAVGSEIGFGELFATELAGFDLEGF